MDRKVFGCIFHLSRAAYCSALCSWLPSGVPGGWWFLTPPRRRSPSRVSPLPAGRALNVWMESAGSALPATPFLPRAIVALVRSVWQGFVRRRARRVPAAVIETSLAVKGRCAWEEPAFRFPPSKPALSKIPPVSADRDSAAFRDGATGTIAFNVRAPSCRVFVRHDIAAPAALALKTRGPARKWCRAAPAPRGRSACGVSASGLSPSMPAGPSAPMVCLPAFRTLRRGRPVHQWSVHAGGLRARRVFLCVGKLLHRGRDLCAGGL